jgi:hypothetical protein
MFNNYLLDKPAALLAADTNGPAWVSRGGNAVACAFGTFGGGTFKLQFSPDGGASWVDYSPQNGVALTLTANGSLVFRLPPGQFRSVLTGSTAPSLNYFVTTADGD